MPRSTHLVAVALLSSALACSCGDVHEAASGVAAQAGSATAASAGGSKGAEASGGWSGAAAPQGGAATAAGRAGRGSARPGGSGGGSGTNGTPSAGGASSAGRAALTGGSAGDGGMLSAGDGGSVDSTSGAAGSSGAPPATGTPTIYWLDVSGKVLSADATNFAVETLVPSAGQGSDGIAVDVAAGYIYWTNMGAPSNDDGSIMRSSLDGSHVTTLVPKGGTHTPKQLELVAEQGKLYWSDREGMRVMRANLDGSDVETLYQSGSTDADRRDSSRWCVGIAVDVAGGYFYWSQKGSDSGHEGSIRRAHLAMPDGDTPAHRSDVEVLFDGEAATCDIDLDLGAGLIYWANRGDDSINRGPMELPRGATAETRTDKATIVDQVDQAIGVFLDHPRGLVYYTDAVGDVGRANQDGSDSKFLLTKGGAFTGIVVVDLPR